MADRRNTEKRSSEQPETRPGPHTEQGKRNSSRNATSHGTCQERFFLLPGESHESFDALRQTYTAQYKLEEPAVPELIETLTERDWLQQRCTLRICKLESQLMEAEAADDDERIDKIEKRLLNAYRYKTAAENSFKRAFQMLDQFRRTRIQDEQRERALNIAEFRATEHAVVARVTNDITLEQKMELILDSDLDVPSEDEEIVP